MKLSYLLLVVALFTISGDVCFASRGLWESLLGSTHHGHNHAHKSLVPNPSPMPAPYLPPIPPIPSDPPTSNGRASDDVVPAPAPGKVDPTPAPNSGDIVLPAPVPSDDDGESPAPEPDVADGPAGPAPAPPKIKSGALANTISYVVVLGSMISLSFSLV
ncbi:hypothetical protein ACHQM5_016706 [Ranunculus cassubicifolius]